MELMIKGTFNEIMALCIWGSQELCEILHIDPYKLCMVDTDKEIFVITLDDINRYNKERQ